MNGDHVSSLHPEHPEDRPALLEGADAEMASVIATHDWSTSALGPPQDWPNALRTVVSLMLDSRVPMWAAWGPSLSMLYNTHYREMLGAKHPRALGRALSDVWAEIWDDVSGLVAKALSGQAIYQEDMPLLINRNGMDEQTWFTFSYSPLRDDAGVIQGLVCTVWESTEKVRGQQRLAQSEARHYALTKASSNVIYRMSPDWRRMLELNGQGFVADTHSPDSSWLDTYIYPEDQATVRAAIDAAIATQQLFELEHRVIRADGSVGWTLSRAVPMIDASGALTEWFGMASDITARKEAESRLVEADRMKDQFLAILAHELRNPLAPIRNGLHLLSVRNDPRQAGDVLGMLGRQVDHLVRLVDDLMEVARISSGSLQLRASRIDVSSPLKAALDLSRPMVEAGRHALQVSYPSERLWIDGDETRLAQVFSNLINNAAKYTLTPGVIRVSVSRDDDTVQVNVTDNGVGISVDDHDRLFTLFGRLNASESKGEGLGVGLALARRLVELHGGSISVRSDGPDTGSSFTVTLPLSQATVPDTPGSAALAWGEFDGLRALVVDDNRDAADSLGALLEILGCKASVFYSASSALSGMDGAAPDIGLFDLGMAGMDGFELAQKIRKVDGCRNILLVAVTGWGQPEDRARTAAAGFDRHLVKPVELERLKAALMAAARQI